ncbi:hypothetical protein B0H67DRAFT_586109 [Lasiosphaeris hirsuta]|uniref:Uncharacterized protein n=1 Tax=Lasiosphaeris hirsuta TaxID=260670 RepID=A0AA40A9E0_9PEZI|nr:hypothetical protein B0H67DRAFT_586109 [Lasiosphaeris hirsuta]
MSDMSLPTDEGGRPSPSHPQSHDFATDISSPVTATPPAPQPGATTPDVSRPSPHVHYALNPIDTSVGGDHTLEGGNGNGNSTSIPGRAFGRSNTDQSAITPISRRRTRVGTFRTVEDFDDFEVRPGWHPGSEPGVDPSKPDGGHASMPTLSAPCDITIVDFSQDNLSIRRLDNETLGPFLTLPQPKWVKCRWINVNGLSWDVIQTLGRHKSLHKLAIEDIMNTRNRTKAEWFPTHSFMVLTLQKLVHLYDSDDDDDDDYGSDADVLSQPGSIRSGRSGRSGRKRSKLWRKVRSLFDGNGRGPTETIETGKPPFPGDVAREAQRQFRSHPTGFSDVFDPSQVRTLQRYHASPNDPRTLFMEKNSALSRKKLAVTCEQVSMFITQDNTIISFFEVSAQDVEAPIVRRLQTSDTIIRQSCDASMVGQAIIDAIIDLAIPVTACYGDVIGDLELDVLTRPTLEHTKSLYVVITEINKMLSFINPIITLINAIRDHKTELGQDATMHMLQDPSKGVIITHITYTYLGDVLDHCVLITESLNQLKSSADGMIGLIFNTISAYQNESMKQLTVATIIFLPLTFLTGYFGQNFEPFTVLKEDVGYFWKIAVPVVVAVILILFKDVIYDYFKFLSQRRYIVHLKKTHRKSRKLKRF